ncbi:peptidylprolyl isomerase [Romboutsia sp. 1001713B170207_170306_H8]|uniref:peptidylprolyl isomerase n=1 Tax=Romboutsia sp. 1001713B170207_170306_H8 TaxID=2787112 RepID=UPI00189BE4E3|nr:peptidylprolyl isomerase [Romboutsia sp. 1001713B170207_170306_H8]
MNKVLYIGLISLACLQISGCSNNIATVNGVKISKDEYEKTKNIIEATSNYINYNYNYNEDNDLKNVIVDFMVDNEVVYQQAKLNGFEPTKQEVEIKYKELEKAIASNPSYKKAIESTNIDEEYLYNIVKKDIAIEKYKQKYKSNLEIRDDEIKDYYFKHKNKFFIEEVNASQILISTLDENNIEVSSDKKVRLKEKAENISQMIKEKQSFEELAKKYSDDRLTGKNGGNLGYFTKDDKNIEFTSVVFSLDKSEVSEVFETSYGYHIVKINDIRNTMKKYDDCKDEIREIILNEKYMNHIEELNKKSKIKS